MGTSRKISGRKAATGHRNSDRMSEVDRLLLEPAEITATGADGADGGQGDSGEIDRSRQDDVVIDIDDIIADGTLTGHEGGLREAKQGDTARVNPAPAFVDTINGVSVLANEITHDEIHQGDGAVSDTYQNAWLMSETPDWYTGKPLQQVLPGEAWDESMPRPANIPSHIEDNIEPPMHQDDVNDFTTRHPAFMDNREGEVDFTAPEQPSPSTNQRKKILSDEIGSIHKLIDAELMKRTLWRQEQQILSNDRKWLDESMDSMLKLVVKRQTAMGNADSTNKRDARSRKRLGLEPIQVDNLESTSPEPPEEGPAAPATSWAKLEEEMLKQYRQTLKDYAEVQTQAKKVTQITDELAKLDFRLVEKLKPLQSHILEMSDLPPTIPLRTPGPSGSDSEASDTPPLVSEYFDRLGDIGVFNERLLELDDAHEDGLMEREFVAERGEEPEVTFDVFEQKFTERREKILEDLVKAEGDADILLRRCKDAGIDVEAHRERRESTYTTSHAANISHVDDGAASSPLLILQRTAPDYAVPKQSFAIDSWLENLPQDDIAYSKPESYVGDESEAGDDGAADPLSSTHFTPSTGTHSSKDERHPDEAPDEAPVSAATSSEKEGHTEPVSTETNKVFKPTPSDERHFADLMDPTDSPLDTVDDQEPAAKDTG